MIAAQRTFSANVRVNLEYPNVDRGFDQLTGSAAQPGACSMPQHQ